MLQSTAHDPNSPITSKEVEVLGPERAARLTDKAALKLVTQDATTAETFINQRGWALGWRETDILYQSPRTVAGWENATATRANVSRFTVAKHVNALVPDMMSGIFYEDPPFILRPRPGTTQDTCRAKSALFAALLDEMDFENEVERGSESQALNGTGFWKWGCYTERKIVEKYVRKKMPAKVAMPFDKTVTVNTQESDEVEVQEVETTRWRPFFEFAPITELLIDPGWRHANQPWKAKYIIHRKYPTFTDLDKLRLQDGYEIPSEAELKALFFAPIEQPAATSTMERAQQANIMVHHAAARDEVTTADPLEFPLKMDERWDENRVMVVLNDKLVIRNEEHKLGRIPFLSANWWNIQNAGYGLGVGRLVGSNQRVEQGSMNAALDILSMAVNQQYVRSRGANVPTQQIRSKLGGIIDVDGKVDEAFKIMEPPKVPGEVWTTIQVSKQEAEGDSGADEAMVQGRLPARGGSSIGRTATGAGNIASASARRIQGPVGRFVKNVLIQFLYILDGMINERMPISEIRGILGDEFEQVIELDIENFLNARLKFEALAGAHLAAKKAMAQALPLMVSILENPHLIEQLNATGYVLDVKELYAMWMEISEWKNFRQLVRKMTPEEQQSFEKFNAALQKQAADQAKQQTKLQGDKEIVDQKAEARLGHDLIMNSADRAAGFEERVRSEHAMAEFGQEAGQ